MDSHYDRTKKQFSALRRKHRANERRGDKTPPKEYNAMVSLDDKLTKGYPEKWHRNYPEERKT